MKERVLFKILKKACATFPAIVVTGPRQSGKTTLLKTTFSKTHSFVTLEDPDIRLRAKDDPRSFLAAWRPPVIIDEIQYVPELLSYIKTLIDEDRTPGQWLFTGSQNFVLMQGVSESLAGRAAIFSLLPFTYSEIIESTVDSRSIADLLTGLEQAPSTLTQRTKTDIAPLILRGGYPELVTNKEVDRQLWCGSYLSTYLERDIRNISNVGDLNQFERFVRLCASRTGQLLNLSEMARDIGVSVPTAKRWLSMLEAGYQIFLLYPYYRNIGKQLIKAPKLYFTDTAMATYLLGIHDEEVLCNHSSFGSLFETYVITDFLKRFYNHGLKPSMYYIRTRDGVEVDLVCESEGALHLFEMKSTATIFPRFGRTLKRLRSQITDVKTATLISRAQQAFFSDGVLFVSWQNILGNKIA